MALKQLDSNGGVAAKAAENSQFDIPPNTGFTIMGWVRIDTTASATNALFGKWGSGNEKSWRLTTDTGNIGRVNARVHPTTHDAESNGAVSTGTWLHFAGVYDHNNELIFYLNGVEDTGSDNPDSVTGNINDSNAQTDVLGNNGDATGEDFRMYRRALTPAEILTIYSCRGVDGIYGNMQIKLMLNEKNSGASIGGAGTVINHSFRQIHFDGQYGTYEPGTIKFRRRV